jgi:tetratricopeptide (TPR) repeat protein
MRRGSSPAGRPRRNGPRAVAGPLLALVVGLAAGSLVAGCRSDEPPPPEPTTAEREQQLQGQIREHSLDPWPHFELAKLYEAEGETDRAVEQYGAAINLLPPRTWTSPVYRLGALHQRLGELDAARRCYLEVLDTVAGDSTRYRSNPEYRAAALGVVSIAAALGELDARAPELAALHDRFLGELGGTEADWAAARKPPGREGATEGAKDHASDGAPAPRDGEPGSPGAAPPASAPKTDEAPAGPPPGGQ